MQALALCQAAGMVSLSQVALDGNKVQHFQTQSDELCPADEFAALLADAQRIDKAKDKNFCKDPPTCGLKSCGALKPDWKRFAKPPKPQPAACPPSVHPWH